MVSIVLASLLLQIYCVCCMVSGHSCKLIDFSYSVDIGKALTLLQLLQLQLEYSNYESMIYTKICTKFDFAQANDNHDSFVNVSCFL